jgi:hypothetical protein
VFNVERLISKHRSTVEIEKNNLKLRYYYLQLSSTSVAVALFETCFYIIFFLTDLSLDDSGTTYVTLPLHLLQDGSILDSGSSVHNLILKNLASSTVYLDASQV